MPHHGTNRFSFSFSRHTGTTAAECNGIGLAYVELRGREWPGASGCSAEAKHRGMVKTRKQVKELGIRRSGSELECHNCFFVAITVRIDLDVAFPFH
jgi:hypothetical protein